MSLAALNALLPVLIVIVVGWAAANIPIIPRDQWAGLDTLMYYVLFPCLIIVALTGTDLTTLPFATLGLALVLSVLAMSALALLVRPFLLSRFGISGPRFTSIFQGATRWNTTVAIAIAGFLFGEEGVALMSVGIVAMIPLLNVLSVGVLSWFAAAEPPSPRRIAMELVKNPLIVSCVIGIALNLSGIVLPTGVRAALDLLGKAGLACGVLAVGAGLDLSSLRRPGPALATGTLMRLLLMPLFAVAFCALLGVEGTARGAAVIAAAVPTASSSYMLARKMGGDAKLIAEIITLQTLLAIATLPLFLWLLT